VIDSQIIFAIIAVNASLFGALLRSPIDILSRPTALSPPQPWQNPHQRAPKGRGGLSRICIPNYGHDTQNYYWYRGEIAKRVKNRMKPRRGPSDQVWQWPEPFPCGDPPARSSPDDR
jgi:hypothetical protein